MAVCSRLAGLVPSREALSHIQYRLLSTPKFQLAPPSLAMPRRKKISDLESSDLEPIQPWERQAAAVSGTLPEPEVVPVPQPKPGLALEPVALEAVPATVAADPPTTSRQSARSPTTASEAEIDALGRQLTKILRHMALDFRLPIRSDGYVAVAELLKLNLTTRARDAFNRGRKLSSHSVADVRQAVALDSKKRMGLMEEDGQLFIRANQGHSMKVIVSERLLKPVLNAQEVPVCVHGTYRQHLKSIFAEGLSKMNRLHVHFATGLPTQAGVISGMRASCEVLIHLNVEKALGDGMQLFKSENGVILTEGFGGVVPVEYFSRVESLPGRKQIPIPSKVVEKPNNLSKLR